MATDEASDAMPLSSPKIASGSRSNYSIGELEALVVKAYRGAGHSWGLAQEAGVASAWMAMHGLEASQPFARLVESIDAQSIQSLSPVVRHHSHWAGSERFLCPVVTGAALSDFGLDSVVDGHRLTLRQVLQPTVLLPFLCRLPLSVNVQINNAVYRCGGGDIQMPGGRSREEDTDPVDVVIDLARQPVAATATLQRAIVDQQAICVLLHYASRTYVPATEASRIAGAGAGLLDND